MEIPLYNLNNVFLYTKAFDSLKSVKSIDGADVNKEFTTWSYDIKYKTHDVRFEVPLNALYISNAHSIIKPSSDIIILKWENRNLLDPDGFKDNVSLTVMPDRIEWSCSYLTTGLPDSIIKTNFSLGKKGFKYSVSEGHWSYVNSNIQAFDRVLTGSIKPSRTSSNVQPFDIIFDMLRLVVSAHRNHIR